MKEKKSIKISLTTAILLVMIFIVAIIAISSVAYEIAYNKEKKEIKAEILNTTLKDERCCNIEESLYKFNELK